MLLFGMENFNQQYQRSPPIRIGREKVYAYLQYWACCQQNTQCTTVVGSFGFQGWLSFSDTIRVLSQRIPSHWHSPFTLPLHSLSVCLSVSFLFFWSWSPPLSPVTCLAICSRRWCHPEKSKSLASPNPCWFTWFSLSQSSRGNKWETGKHISRH